MNAQITPDTLTPADELIAQTRVAFAGAETKAQKEAVILEALRSQGQEHRYFEIEKRQSEGEDEAEDERSIAFSFSSDEPVLRWWGYEILDHKPESIRMDRLRNGAPLLLDHRANNANHIGVIESADIDSGRGLAVARLGSAQKSEDALTDIRDGILHNVSVGYLVHRVTLEEESDDKPPTYRITDWEPLEVSLVSVPADTSVGIGRGYQLKREIQMTTESEVTQDPVDITLVADQAAEQARSNELQRMRDIGAVRAMYKGNPQIVAAADRALESGETLEEFRAKVIPLFRSTPIPADDQPVTDIGMSDREVKQFSIVRAVRAILAAKTEGRDAAKLAPFEFECSRAVADELDREARGVFVPWDVQRAAGWPRPRRITRAVPMDTSENDDLVATEHLAGSFIDALFERSTVLRLGAMVLPGLVGNVDIPGFASGMSWGWITEDEDSADTEPVTKTVALSPKTVSGSVPITRRLIKQSSPAIEMLLRSHMINGSGEAIDAGALVGSGSSGQPTGVLNTTGINTTIVNPAGQPTFPELVAFETEVATDKALAGNLAYITTPGTVGYLKTTALDAGSGRFMMENGQANGYPCEGTTNMSGSAMLFGAWNMVIVGMWGVLDINVDTATRAKKGGLVLRAFQDVDVGVAQPVAFCKDVLT